jgi:hypothetical protein
MPSSMIAVSAFKPSRNSHIGINLWESPVVSTTPEHQQQRHLIVVHIDDHSVFSQSHLKVGMKIDYVNDISVARRNYSAADVVRLLQAAEGCVTILASAPGFPGVAAPTPLRHSTPSTASFSSTNSPLPAMNDIDSSSSSDDEDDDDFGMDDLDRQIRTLWQPLLLQR